MSLFFLGGEWHLSWGYFWGGHLGAGYMCGPCHSSPHLCFRVFLHWVVLAGYSGVFLGFFGDFGNLGRSSLDRVHVWVWPLVTPPLLDVYFSVPSLACILGDFGGFLGVFGGFFGCFGNRFFFFLR